MFTMRVKTSGMNLLVCFGRCLQLFHVYLTNGQYFFFFLLQQDETNQEIARVCVLFDRTVRVVRLLSLSLSLTRSFTLCANAELFRCMYALW